MRRSSRKEWARAFLVLIPLLGGCAGNDLPVDATPEDILTHAQRKLDEEEYFDAAEALEYFLRSHPGTASTPLAKLRLGDARFGLEEYVLAEAQYQDIVADFPASPHVEESRFKIARCSWASALPYYLDQTETERALGLLEEFRRDYPESRWLPDAEAAIAQARERLSRGEYESGRFYEERRRFKPAAIQYKFVVERYPETPWAPKAALGLANMYAARQRVEDAEAWYRRVAEDWPDTDEARLAREALAQGVGSPALSQGPGEKEAP
jgi:outer membrane protein assembly factor BamD